MSETIDVSNLAGGTDLDGENVSWDTPGMIVAGELLQAKYRTVTDKRTGDKEDILVLTLSTAEGNKKVWVRQMRLKEEVQKLGKLTTGEIIKIKYTGEDRMPNGHTPKNFVVKRETPAAPTDEDVF